MRLRYLLAEPDPLIVGYDQDRWAKRFDYHAHPIDAALATVTAVRANTVPLLQRATEQDWRRVAGHTEAGPYGPRDRRAVNVGHLVKPSGQNQGNPQAWRKTPNGHGLH